MAIISQRPELTVLYQDDTLIAIDKPSGLFVHRSFLDKDEKYFALQLVRDIVGQHVYPVHRLDRPTSGVLLFTKSSAVAHELALQFEQHSIEKQYLAITRGFLSEQGEIDHPLIPKLDKIADKFAVQDKAPQSAFTAFSRLATASLPIPLGKYPSVRYSLVKLLPKTGRQHQLRRHLGHLRHPIIGDINYGDNKQNPFFAQHFGLKRLMLHAHSLTFVHPETKQKITINAPIDMAWQQIFQQLGWEGFI